MPITSANFLMPSSFAAIHPQRDAGRIESLRLLQSTDTLETATPVFTTSRLVETMQTGSAADVTQSLAAAKESAPEIYRQAVREFVMTAIGHEPRLQRHLELFDRSGNRKVTMAETYSTARALGFNPVSASLIVFVSNIVAGPSTHATWGDTFSAMVNGFEIDIDGIAGAQHPEAHSGAFDAGIADAKLQEKIDSIFAFATGPNETITKADISNYVNSVAEQSKEAGNSYFSIAKARFANEREFLAVFRAIKSETLSRQDMKDFYDGPLLFAALPADELAIRVMNMRQ